MLRKFGPNHPLEAQKAHGSCLWRVNQLNPTSTPIRVSVLFLNWHHDWWYWYCELTDHSLLPQIHVKAMMAIPNGDGTQDIVRGHSIFTGRQDDNLCDISIHAGPGDQTWYAQVSDKSKWMDKLSCCRRKNTWLHLTSELHLACSAPFIDMQVQLIFSVKVTGSQSSQDASLIDLCFVRYYQEDTGIRVQNWPLTMRPLKWEKVAANVRWVPTIL